MTVHKDDWFRKACLTTDEIANFETRLNRSRSSRHEYMRIQAGALELAGQYNRAIELIERIELEDADHFALSLLYQSKASCYRKLRQNDLAIHWYKAALDRERAQPTVITSASTDFPFWVATERLKSQYDDALSVLISRIDPQGLFPIILFKQYAAMALILADLGNIEEAKPSARAALLHAERTHSNATKHRWMGLVGGGYVHVHYKLRRIAAGKSPRSGIWNQILNFN
jgi:tetratricopeptide (TPR) repeat protein